MKYATYSEYKPSHVDWLGDVPSHWAVKAIKWESPVLRGASPRPIDDPIYFDDDGEYAWVRIADVTEAGTYLEYTEQNLSDIGARLSVKLKPGDLFLSIAGSVGKPCITRIKCCIHDGFVYFPRWRADPKFLYYLFASGEPYKGLGKMGTQLNLNTDTVGSIVIGLPDAEEQQSIARFLDAKTAEIDALVAQKRQLIAKLKEKRQALIARTVTRGLPPEAAKAVGLEPSPQMKDSGVEWLGEIPSHWKAMRAKYLCSAVVDCKNRTPEYFDDGEYLVVRTTDVRDGQLRFEGMLRTDKENFRIWTERGAPRAGDVVFTREAPAGEAAIFDGSVPMCLGQRMMYFRIDPKQLSSRYLLHWLYGSASRGYIDSMSGGSTVTHLRVGQVHDFPIATPPILEQLAIADYLDDQASILDELTARAEVAITRLAEYRQALITSAVTGKIDVRGLA